MSRNYYGSEENYKFSFIYGAVIGLIASLMLTLSHDESTAVFFMKYGFALMFAAAFVYWITEEDVQLPVLLTIIGGTAVSFYVFQGLFPAESLSSFSF